MTIYTLLVIQVKLAVAKIDGDFFCVSYICLYVEFLLAELRCRREHSNRPVW